MKEKIENFLNLKMKVLMVSRYRRIGRPRKSDYTVCKIKEVRDVQGADALGCGCKTFYT